MAASARPGRILLAEDDEALGELIALALGEAGYGVVRCRDGFELVAHLGSLLLPHSAERCDLIVSDIRMPNVTGMEVLEGMRHLDGFPPLILITAFGDAQTHEKACRYGAAALLDKPFAMEDLVAKVDEVVGRPRPSEATDSGTPPPR